MLDATPFSIRYMTKIVTGIATFIGTSIPTVIRWNDRKLGIPRVSAAELGLAA
jgi:hypothetical protein